MDEAPAMLPCVFIQWRSIMVFISIGIAGCWTLLRLARCLPPSVRQCFVAIYSSHFFPYFPSIESAAAFAFHFPPVIPLFYLSCLFSPFRLSLCGWLARVVMPGLFATIDSSRPTLHTQRKSFLPWSSHLLIYFKTNLIVGAGQLTGALDLKTCCCVQGKRSRTANYVDRSFQLAEKPIWAERGSAHLEMAGERAGPV